MMRTMIGMLAAVAVAAPLYAEELDADAVRAQRIAVTGVVKARANIVAGDIAGCPSAAAKCQRKAYLVPGDPIILGPVKQGYVTVSFTSAKGTLTEGFLPAAALGPAPAPGTGWTGHWVREEAEIDIRPGKRPGTFAIDGDATWGARDPDRVKRGGVNIGGIGGEAAPTGSYIRIGDAKAQFDCAFSLRQVGQYLVVADNRGCGGMNVSFIGTYRRAGPAQVKKH